MDVLCVTVFSFNRNICNLVLLYIQMEVFKIRQQYFQAYNIYFLSGIISSVIAILIKKKSR